MSTPSTPSSAVSTMLSNIVLTEGDMSNPSQFVGLLNQILQNHYQVISSMLGSTGTTTFNTPVDMSGNRITNAGDAVESGDLTTKSFTEANYSPAVMSAALEAGGSNPLQTYRRLSDNNQREKSSTFLNDITNTAPTANDSTVSAESPSGGYTQVTISSGTLARVDGTLTNYTSFTDSLPVPTDASITSMSRASGVVTATMAAANTLAAGDSVTITGAADSTFNSTVLLATVSTDTLTITFKQEGSDATTTGGTMNLSGVYYYYIGSRSQELYRYPYSFSSDTVNNRVTANQDGTTMVAVVTITADGLDTVNSAAGGTDPLTNVGAGVRLMTRL